MLSVDQIVAYDTSAIYAAFFERDEGMDYMFYLTRRRCLIGWPTFFELQTVLTHKTGRNDQHEFINLLVAQPNIISVDFTLSHYATAAEAMVQYGKGTGSDDKANPAKLNFGDCMAYAIAKVAKVPLIFKGDDFIHTDINSNFA